MHKIVVLMGSALVLGALSGPAAAMEDFSSVNCLSHGYLTIYLDRAFGESKVASGELENGNAVELYAARSGTWTLVEVRSDGRGCVQASGKRMQVERTTRSVAREPS